VRREIAAEIGVAVLAAADETAAPNENQDRGALALLPLVDVEFVAIVAAIGDIFDDRDAVVGRRLDERLVELGGRLEYVGIKNRPHRRDLRRDLGRDIRHLRLRCGA
jgi:hypothetical protein